MVLSSTFRGKKHNRQAAIRTESCAVFNSVMDVEEPTLSEPSLQHPGLPNRTVTPSAIIVRGMLGGQSSEEWIAKYERSHQHPVNRLCHTYGIPTILVSVAVFAAGFVRHRLWWWALALFIFGWLLQFIGHAFEGKPPEFFHDWRFLFVGVRWWWAKINGKA
jgi:hypothetical protein